MGPIRSYLKPPRVDSTGKQIDCPPDKCWLHLSPCPVLMARGLLGCFLLGGVVMEWLRNLMRAYDYV